MLIYSFDKWNDLNEDRITPISMFKFKELLSKYCHTNKSFFLYKKIIDPTSNVGLFFKSTKKFEKHIEEIKTSIKPPIYQRNDSLICYNYIENEPGVTFIVFPFKSSMFTFSKTNDIIETVDDFNKGYWIDKIKWLEKMNTKEMWTESPCLLIEKNTWDKIKPMTIKK